MLGRGAHTIDCGTMPVTPGAGEGGKARYEALSTIDAGPTDSPDESKPASRVVRHASLAKPITAAVCIFWVGFSVRFYYLVFVWAY